MDRTWLNDLLAETDEAETPRQWILWSGLSAIGAVAGPNVWLDKFYYKLSPNMYVMLIGKSGLGKGLGTWLAKVLVEGCNITRVMAGRNSIEAIISELSKSKSREDGEAMLKDARAYLISGEFANFIIQSPNALTILTEWYDTHYLGEWKNTLKHSGVEKLKGLNISLLGAASPAHFKDFVSERDVEGGFIGRTLLIYAEKRHRINPLTVAPETVMDIDRLVKGLQDISKIKGEFKWEKDASILFGDWYRKYRSIERDDKTGTDQRFPDHILKVAMCLSLSKRDELVLYSREIEQSIEICTTLTHNVRRALFGSGKNLLAQGTKLLLEDLIKAPDNKVSRTKTLQKHWGDLDSFDLDKIQVTLLQANMITIDSDKNDMYFILTPEFKEQYKAMQEKKGDA